MTQEQLEEREQRTLAQLDDVLGLYHLIVVNPDMTRDQKVGYIACAINADPGIQGLSWMPLKTAVALIGIAIDRRL